MFIARVSIPAREDIIPTHVLPLVIPERPKIKTEQIYKYDDLFGTYKKEEEQIKPREEPKPIPAPPPVVMPEIPPLPKPQFLPPMDVTLKGIVTISHDDSKNRAIIENKAGQQAVYRVSDMIEDAQLMRIFPMKVIFIRSNGQQEVLYLREKDAKSDPAYMVFESWEDIIQETGTNAYTVDPTLFIERVKTLAQFIEMLDLTTVYKQGKTVGCRIGYIYKDSLGYALGMRPGDIVVRVNGIPVTDKIRRTQIYRAILNVRPEEPITVDIVRDNGLVKIRIMVQQIKKVVSVEEAVVGKQVEMISTETLQEKEARILKEKFKLAPTLKEIRERERKNMMHQGRRMKPSIVE